MKTIETRKRLPWLLPSLTALVTLLSSQLAQASMSLVICDSGGNTNFTNVQPGSSYNLTLYALVQDSNGHTVGTSGDWVTSLLAGVDLSGGLVTAKNAYFAATGGFASVTYPSNATISSASPQLWGSTSSGTIGIGSSSTAPTSVSGGIYTSKNNSWKTAPAGMPAFALAASYPNYTAYGLATFTVSFSGSLPSGSSATMGLIEGSGLTAADTWYENTALRMQNGNNGVTGSNAGTLGGLLDSITFSTTGASVPATYLSSAAVSGLREMQSGTSQPGSITITNGGSASGAFTLANTGADALSFGTSSGTLAAIGGKTTSSLGWVSTATTGPRSGAIALTGLTAGDVGSPQTVAVSGAVVSNRTVTSTSASFGLVHLGQTISPQGITLSTTGSDNYYTRVTVNNAGPDGNGLSVSGGANPVFSGPAVTDSRTLSGTPTAAGLISGTISLSTNGEGLAGESPIPVEVSYSGQVFSGNAQWTSTSGNTSWGVNANWSDTTASGVNAAPGVWGVTGDSALLGPGGGGTITLDGANPSLASLTFSNSTAGYTLSAGSGGTLTFAAASGGSICVQSGTHSITAPISLLSPATIDAAPGAQLSIAGRIAEVPPGMAITITGGGYLALAASNGYTGPTTVSDGSILRLSSSAALPGGAATTSTGSNLTLDGGVVELAAGDFTRNLGSGQGQVRFTANGGGFAAVGTNRVVNLGGNSAQLTWGSGSFLPSGAPLMLGTPSADSTIDFQNPLDLGAATQTVLVTAGSGYVAVDARLSGALSGSGGLTVAGGGNLELTAANSYAGATTVSAAILRLSNSAALPAQSNLVLDGGMVELNAGDFSLNLGTGSGQVQFTANGGGFAAVGANRVVNLSNSAALTWGGSGSFLPGGAPLILGSWSANSLVDFQNPIDLGSGVQTVEVPEERIPLGARMSGSLSGSGGLTVAGWGELDLTAANSYTGPTTVSGGILRLSNSAALPGGTGAGATGSNLTLDAGVVELAAGDFTRGTGTAAGQVQFTAYGGGFSAVGGNRVVNLGGNSAALTWGGSGGFLPPGAALLLGSLASDSTLDFQNPIQLLAAGGPQIIQVTLGSGTAAVAAQLSGVVSGDGGLTITGGGDLALTASNCYTGPTTVSGGMLRLSNSAALPAQSNLVLDGGVVELVTGDFTHSLGSGSGQVQFTSYGGGFSASGANRAVNLGGNSATLTWDDGGFLPNGAPLKLGASSADSTIDFQNPIILGSGQQPVVVMVGCGTAAVDAELSGDLSGSGGLMITGDGTLLLSGTDNTYTGGTLVDSTRLILGTNGAVPDGSSLTVIDGGTLLFDASAAGGSIVPLGVGQPTAAVPEPGTLVLWLTALAVAIGIAWRRPTRKCF